MARFSRPQLRAIFSKVKRIPGIKAAGVVAGVVGSYYAAKGIRRLHQKSEVNKVRRAFELRDRERKADYAKNKDVYAIIDREALRKKKPLSKKDRQSRFEAIMEEIKAKSPERIHDPVIPKNKEVAYLSQAAEKVTGEPDTVESEFKERVRRVHEPRRPMDSYERMRMRQRRLRY